MLNGGAKEGFMDRIWHFLPWLSMFLMVFGFILPQGYLSQRLMVKPLFILMSLFLFALWLLLYRQNIQRWFLRRSAFRWLNLAFSALLAILVAAGFSFFMSSPRLDIRFDLTRDLRHTLSPQSIKVIERFADSSETIEVKGFFKTVKVKEQFARLLHQYRSHGLGVAHTYIDPDADPTETVKENITLANTVILRWRGSEERITHFGEQQLTNGLIKLLKPRRKHILFVKGHGQKDIGSQEEGGLSILTEDLKQHGYKVSQGALLTNQDLTEKALDLIVVAGPKYDLRPPEIEVLDRFLYAGGSVLILADALTPLSRLNHWLNKAGIDIGNDFLLLDPADPRVSLLGQKTIIIDQFDAFDDLTKDLAAASGTSLILSSVRTVKPLGGVQNLKARVVASTSEDTIALLKVASPKDLQDKDTVIDRGRFPVMVAATGMSQGDRFASRGDQGVVKPEWKLARPIRLVVAGTSDFVTNHGVQRAENFDMAMNVINYLTRDEDLISLRPKRASGQQLHITKMSQMVLVVICFVVPFLFLAAGMSAWMRRR